MPATRYPHLFTWGVYSRSTNAFGDVVPNEAWADNGNLRGRMESVNPNEETRYEAKALVLRSTVHIRQYIGLKPLDRLTDVDGGTVWKVLTVYPGDNETICELESV